MDLLQTLIRYIRLYSEIRVSTTLIIGMLSVSLGSCMLSGFKPRGEILLPSSFSHLYISGLDQRTNFYIQLKSALEQRGSIVVGHKPDATTILQISHLRETKKVASYERKIEKMIAAINTGVHEKDQQLKTIFSCILDFFKNISLAILRL